MRLIAQAPQQIGGTSLNPGDVLPSSVHSWELLPDAVRRCSIWPEGNPSSRLVDAITRAPLGDLSPQTLIGIVRRGAAVSSDPTEPAPLHAAAMARDIMVRQGHAQRFAGPPEKPQQVQQHKRR